MMRWRLGTMCSQQPSVRMRKAVKAVTRLAKQKETEETEYIGKEEILKGIDAGLKEMVERKHSGNKAKTLEELINEL